MKLHIRRVALWSLVVLALAQALSAQGVDPLLKERVWTDQQGRRMRARFERIENGNLILSSGGATTVVPLSQLSDADREFLDNPNPAPATPTTRPAPPGQDPAPVISTPRPWTINGRQVIGGIKSADERGLVLQTAAGDFQLTYDVLADDADVLEAARYLNSIGRGDLAQRLADRFEQLRGRAFPMPAQSDKRAASDPADVDSAPVYESPDKVLDVGVPHPAGRATQYETADKLLGPSTANTATAKADEARFQRNVIYGGLTLFAAIGAIITYGWWTSRAKQHEP